MADGSRPGTEKFTDPVLTADGQQRAWVNLKQLETLWFNTGTLCNIECANCYILSSPKNDALVYLGVDDIQPYLDEIRDHRLGTGEIGFTGGEPFMNPKMCAMAELALQRGFNVLILTNAMRPMMRPRVQQPLAGLATTYGDKLTLRISLDHHSADVHDRERGQGTFDRTLQGMRWLRDEGIRMAVAGRTLTNEDEDSSRAAFQALFDRENFAIDSQNPAELVLFPEMDERVEVPEITTACWDILGKTPDMVMCSNSRMVVKRRGTDAPAVLACTLLAYDPQFELGRTLVDASVPVPLNHRHCAKFCVLGGARCSA
ncbi:MAG: radical SAM protein [Pseudomonadota bacterium]